LLIVPAGGETGEARRGEASSSWEKHKAPRNRRWYRGKGRQTPPHLASNRTDDGLLTPGGSWRRGAAEGRRSRRDLGKLPEEKRLLPGGGGGGGRKAPPDPSDRWMRGGRVACGSRPAEERRRWGWLVMVGVA